MSLSDQVVYLLNGLAHSLLITVLGIALATVIGLLVGGLGFLGGRGGRFLAATYVNAFRCTPVLVQVFMLFYALPELGIRLSAFGTSWLALGLWGGAYQAETFRAGFGAVPRHEILAARALGLPARRTFLDITMPLGIRNAWPAATTTAITQFRTSSFMVVIGYQELTYAANRLVSETFQVVQVFGAAAVMYLAVSGLIALVSGRFEARFGRSDARSAP